MYLTSSLYSEILIFVLVCYILCVFWVKYFWYLTYPTPSVWCVFCLLRRLLLTSSLYSEILLLISLRSAYHTFSLYSEILLLISLWLYILYEFWNITTDIFTYHTTFSVFWNISTDFSVIVHPKYVLKYNYKYISVIIHPLYILKYYYWYLCDYISSSCTNLSPGQSEFW